MIFRDGAASGGRSLGLASALALSLTLTLTLFSLRAHAAAAQPLTVAVLSLADDPRYQSRRLERLYPGHPGGRPLEAAQVAADESSLEMEALGQKLQVKAYTAASNAELPRMLAQMKAAKVQHVLLDLPDDSIAAVMALAPAALGPAVWFNIGSASDDLRGAGCNASVLHTYPSQAMQSDALAQYLAARSWNQALVLYGPLAADQLQLAAFLRSAKRYGVKVGKQTAFKLSTDPRERALANVRLLTNDKSFDVVVVIDSEGEFARGIPYNTQFPRPVLGASGLSALAWHAQWGSNGGPQLSRRFAKLAQRPMAGQDWAAWVAVKSIVSVLTENPKATPLEQLQMLRQGDVFVDGFKGPRLSYRPWDGQLRQPIFLASADGVAAVAPFDGVLHPSEVLDTLGVDEKESPCKARP